MGGQPKPAVVTVLNYEDVQEFLAAAKVDDHEAFRQCFDEPLVERGRVCNTTAVVNM